MAKILKVEAYGVAYKARIKKGEDLVAINGKPIVDVLDYVYAEGQNKCTLTIANRNGELRDVVIKKSDAFDTLGLELDESIEINEPRRCANNCKFCFVAQLPKGMRKSLYVKDDDYRLSFTCGSYITCTNLKQADIDRIIEYKLSPLYISVHATDDEVRTYLLGTKKVVDQMALLKKFTENGIKLHTQIVLVGGVNDGKVLRKSLEDVMALGENALTMAVVPVGLTGHREGLTPIEPLTKQQARDAIAIVEEYYNKRPYFAYCSDEMYQIADISTPKAEYYGEFEQIENGVGLIAKFLDEVEYALQDAPTKVKKRVAIITGVSGESTMRKATELIQEKWRKVKVDIYVIKNDFFGHTVTVSGLVTAGDIIKQMAGINLTDIDLVMIPSVMLREFEEVFLDNQPLSAVEKALNHKILVTEVDGMCFVDTIAFE
ncbi:MAG: DUF512 domain-containing protein [Bacillota bacterium]